MVAVSSASTSRTPTPTARKQAEPRSGGGDICYFPGCRKDANCHCDICIESFNATRDLHSALRFPRKKNSTMNPSPPSSDSDPHNPPSSPEPVSSVSTIPQSLRSKPAKKSRPKEKSIKREEEKGWVSGGKVLLALVGVWVFLAVDSGVLKLVLNGFGPKLETEMVREFAEEAKVLERGLKGRLGIIERRVEGAVGGDGSSGRVSNCSSLDSVWKLNQDGHHLLFQWRCVIYKSIAEELSVWGSPLETLGVLTAGVSSRSLTLVSGKITEWSEGNLVPASRMSNGCSWTLEKWSSTAVRLEGETWVLEYQRSALFQGPGLIQTTWQVLRHRKQRMVKKLKWRLLFSGAFGSSSHQCSSRERTRFTQPT